MAKFYQVGGSVRDELLGLKSKDIDYAVEAEGFEAMRQAIVERGGEIFLETPAYFTIRARVPELGACDFVLCRKDGEYKDGRRPKSVEPGTIFDDLARRDFTVNAIAKTEDGTLIDPHGGIDHVHCKILRCVGSTDKRFDEDGLRMIRAIRFHVTKDLRIHNDIVECLMNPVFFVHNLRGVSAERVREELVKCFQHNTKLTLQVLNIFDDLRDYIFSCWGLWLKPTLEAR
jgi:tRNA nucleotidyltransferase (CCA-adding enzyme)